MRKIALEEAFCYDGPATKGSFPDLWATLRDLTGRAVRFLDTAPFSAADLARIAHGNADRPLRR